MSLYLVQQVDARGHAVCDVEAWLALARSPQHAVDLVVADGWRAEDCEGDGVALMAQPAEWTRGGEQPLPLVTRETIQYGIWHPPSDVTWAGYGGVPDGWQYCGGCGLVREEVSEWSAGGDDCDECTGCGHQGCDAAADWIDPAGVSWCAEHRDRGIFGPELSAALTSIPAEDPGDLGDLHHARIAADEAIGWLTGDRADLATAEAWLTRSLSYVRRERARLRGGAP